MFIVMMKGSWGRGASIDEADRKARSEGGHGRKKVKRVVYMYDAEKSGEVGIDSWGAICWTGDVEPTVIERFDPDAKKAD